MSIFMKKDRVIELSEKERGELGLDKTGRVHSCETDNSLCYLHLNWYH